MAKKPGTRARAPEGNPALEGLNLAGDWLSILALLFSIFVSLSVLLFMFTGGSWLGPLADAFSALKVYVFPWIIVLGLLSIGREFWAIRVYLQHIHLGSILEKELTKEAR